MANPPSRMPAGGLPGALRLSPKVTLRGRVPAQSYRSSCRNSSRFSLPPCFPHGAPGAQGGCVSCLRSHSPRAGDGTNSANSRFLHLESVCCKNSFRCASTGLCTLILLAGKVAEGSNSKYGKGDIRLRHNSSFKIPSRAQCVSLGRQSANSHL